MSQTTLNQSKRVIVPELTRKQKFNLQLKKMRKNCTLYIFLIPTLLYFIIFHYVPLYGIQIAFKDFVEILGIWDSPWVGFEHFQRFFNSFQLWDLIRNTLLINIYEILIAFPIPIILALLMNQVNNKRFQKLVQTVTYAPHFISLIVMVGMLFLFLSPSTGFINQIIEFFGGELIYFMGSNDWFKSIFVGSGIWQNAGWSAVLYLAGLAAVDPQLHEAAIMDGASKLQRILYIDLPGIMPIISIRLILQFDSIVTLGYQKILLMQNPLNMAASEVVQTYVYKTGLLNSQYSYATAVGLIQNIVNFIILILANRAAKKFNQESLF